MITIIWIFEYIIYIIIYYNLIIFLDRTLTSSRIPTKKNNHAGTKM